VIVALVLSACGSSSTTSSSTSTASSSASATSTASSQGTQIGFEGVPLEQGAPLASAGTTGTGTVHGIACGPTEQLAYHIHAHLVVFESGSMRSLPGGIGIPGSSTQQTQQGPVAQGGQCIYWLHTHTSDGVIHVESPTQRVYSLGDFFDEWRQPLTANQVAGVRGKIMALVNGQRWNRSVRAIPLGAHEDIQLDIGQPTPPLVTVNWGQTGL
jgi:hypothetical protein